MITLVRAGAVDGWDQLIAAVKDALRLGISDAAAVLHCCICPIRSNAASMPLPWPKNWQQYERPMPVMDDYDLLLANTPGGIQ